MGEEGKGGEGQGRGGEGQGRGGEGQGRGGEGRKGKGRRGREGGGGEGKERGGAGLLTLGVCGYPKLDKVVRHNAEEGHLREIACGGDVCGFGIGRQTGSALSGFRRCC